MKPGGESARGEGAPEAGDSKRPAPSDARIRERVTALALKILAARPRSESQLRERLMARPWARAELVDECIVKLKELGYVDDTAFAHSYANYRLNAKPVGRSRVARELAGKRVARETIARALDSVFEDVDQEALIDRAVEKRIRTHGLPSDKAAEKRMFDYLVRLGFEYDLVIGKLRAIRYRAGDE